MVVNTFTPHIAKLARFSLGRFTNRWANEEELKKQDAQGRTRTMECDALAIPERIIDGDKESGSGASKATTASVRRGDDGDGRESGEDKRSHGGESPLDVRHLNLNSSEKNMGGRLD
ncbi:hypothetical protein NHQ30_004637 [Ciborinia camelliae]|nr:hypothetical protein NHQ30_004637 [Ciborinia camelliae]